MHWEGWRPHNNQVGKKLLTRRQSLKLPALLFGVATSRPALAAQDDPARTFYVSSLASDSNTGTQDSPFATIGRAVQAVARNGANHSILVMPGTYREQVIVSTGGDPTGDLVIRSIVPHAAKIRSPVNTYSAVNIVQSYVTFEGFDVSAGGDGPGIEATFIDGDSKNNGPHHITILDNISHGNAGSGISVSYGDFYRIEGNTCFGNCATSIYQGSGISIYAARAVSGTDGFRNFIRNNYCYENMTLNLPGDPEPAHSDGNGIIIDDLKNTQSGHPAGAYKFRTLVENNVAYRNGGRGVHVFLSDNVIVANNTCCYNNRDPLNPATWRGDLSSVDSGNCEWVNNLAVADPAVNPDNTAILDGASTIESGPNVWRRNLTFDGRPQSASVRLQRPNAILTSTGVDANILGADPLFIRGGVDVATPDFRLRPDSPARGAGIVWQGESKIDVEGSTRTGAGEIDIGAYEFRH